MGQEMENKMFTEQEFELLMSALDALEKQPMGDALSLSMLTVGLSKDKESAREDFERILKEGREKSRSQEESIILIKAKLIQMRDKSVVDAMKSHLINPNDR